MICSSSSEIEINEPIIDVTTPQIEAMQFMFGSTNGMNKQASEMRLDFSFFDN